jgi:predicted TIM-barrel fold metal-dependent hydrolase
MIIDDHQHVNWYGTDVHGLIKDMDKNGIDKAWLLTWEIAPEEDAISYHPVLNPEHLRPDGTHSGLPLCDCIKAKQMYPDRFVLGYTPHPLKGNAPELFKAAYKMHGVRVCGELKVRVLIDDPRCINLFRMAGELGCPVIVHLDIPYLPDEQGNLKYIPDWYGGTIANLERAIKACPETNFIGHAPGFWREISGDAEMDCKLYPQGPVVEGGKLYRLFKKYSNLYGCISANSGLTALNRDPEHAKKFVTAFADRILFGRDFFGSDWQDFLNSLKLSQNIMDRVYFKNALKLVKPGFPIQK